MATLVAGAIAFSAIGQNQSAVSASTNAEAKSTEAKAKSDTDSEKKAAEWVASLKLSDVVKESRVTDGARSPEAIGERHGRSETRLRPPALRSGPSARRFGTGGFRCRRP